MVRSQQQRRRNFRLPLRPRARSQDPSAGTTMSAMQGSCCRCTRQSLLGSKEQQKLPIAAWPMLMRASRTTPIGLVFGRGASARSGSVGLLVAALDERRWATLADDRDPLLLALGRTLIRVVNADGSVGASIDTTTGSTSGRSPFFTGEVLWASGETSLDLPGREVRRIRVACLSISHRGPRPCRVTMAAGLGSLGCIRT